MDDIIMREYLNPLRLSVGLTRDQKIIQSFISFNINLNSERIDAVTPHTFRPSKL